MLLCERLPAPAGGEKKSVSASGSAKHLLLAKEAERPLRPRVLIRLRSILTGDEALGRDREDHGHNHGGTRFRDRGALVSAPTTEYCLPIRCDLEGRDGSDQEARIEMRSMPALRALESAIEEGRSELVRASMRMRERRQVATGQKAGRSAAAADSDAAVDELSRSLSPDAPRGMDGGRLPRRAGSIRSDGISPNLSRFGSVARGLTMISSKGRRGSSDVEGKGACVYPLSTSNVAEAISPSQARRGSFDTDSDLAPAAAPSSEGDGKGDNKLRVRRAAGHLV